MYTKGGHDVVPFIKLMSKTLSIKLDSVSKGLCILLRILNVGPNQCVYVSFKLS